MKGTIRGDVSYDPDTITVDIDEKGYLILPAINNRTWHRINFELNSVNVCNFGAISNGKKD